MATSFSGGRSRSTQREPPIMAKQLVNFITCGCESSAFFCYLQSRTWTHAVLVIWLYELLGNPTTYLIEPPGLLAEARCTRYISKVYSILWQGVLDTVARCTRYCDEVYPIQQRGVLDTEASWTLYSMEVYSIQKRGVIITVATCNGHSS